jgi:hypothetical protein
MQISKWFSAVCAVAFCVSFITVRADDNPAQAAARAALEETTRNLDTQQAPTNAAATAVIVTPASVAPAQTPEPAMSGVQPAPTKPGKKAEAPQTAKAPNLVKEPGLQPIVAPPLPISPDKQAQLQALLAKYKADLVTAEQYQTERAKILGDP